MADNNTIRANARAQLGGNIFANNWLMMLVVGVIYSVVLGLGSYIPGAILIIGGPLYYGIARVSINRACGNEKIEVMDLFKGFTDNFVGSLILGILQSLFIVLWSLLFIIPGIVKGYSYSMAFYIQQDDPSKDWRTCLDESSKMMYGYRWQLFCNDVVMYLWSLVGACACGIGVLFVLPYQCMTRANFYLARKAAMETYANPSETV